MNTRPAIETSSNPVALSVSFNQDCSFFAVGLDTGFCIYNSEQCTLQVSRDFSAGIGAVQMIGRANYVALIGGGRNPRFPQNEVHIWDDAKTLNVITIPVLTTVRGVRLSKSHIVIALQNSVRVYRFKAKPELWGVYQTADNPLGLCCLTEKTLAFPGRTPGQLQLVDLVAETVSIIPAHGSSLRAINISRDGEILATASDTGTLVRVFATSNGARIAELRRGVDHATIYSIAIAPGGQLIAVTSDKSTLHVFDIPHPSKPPRSETPNAHRRLTSITGSGSRGGSPALAEPEASQKWGILSKIPLMPRVFSDVYSFASQHFEIGEETLYGGASPLNSPDIEGVRPPKGIIGWTSDHSLIVVGAGKDGRWEKFIIAEGEDGKRYCIREGWKRYLGGH